MYSHANNLPILALITGDLTHVKATNAYTRLQQQLNRLSVAVFLAARQSPITSRRWRQPTSEHSTDETTAATTVAPVLLDTHARRNEAGGAVSQSGLTWLATALARTPDKRRCHVHAPPATACGPLAWLDPQTHCQCRTSWNAGLITRR